MGARSEVAQCNEEEPIRSRRAVAESAPEETHWRRKARPRSGRLRLRRRQLRKTPRYLDRVNPYQRDSTTKGGIPAAPGRSDRDEGVGCGKGRKDTPSVTASLVCSRRLLGTWMQTRVHRLLKQLLIATFPRTPALQVFIAVTYARVEELPHYEPSKDHRGEVRTVLCLQFRTDERANRTPPGVLGRCFPSAEH